MIPVERSQPPPAKLSDEASPGARETRKATIFYSEPANSENSFDFSVYKDPEIKAALNDLFFGKCAYCESRIAAVAPADVEHYRPKGAVTLPDGSKTKLGYYWLAADWDNLLPSCIDCNRERHQEGPDWDGVSGKANQFPLLDEAARATSPGDEVGERPDLLDPCRDTPAEHLEFFEEGGVRAAAPTGANSRRGEATIKVLGLDRQGLIEDRNDRELIVERTLRHFKRAWLSLNDNPQNAAAKEEVRKEKEELDRLVNPRSPYSGMARQRIQSTLRELGIDIDPASV